MNCKTPNRSAAKPVGPETRRQSATVHNTKLNSFNSSEPQVERSTVIHLGNVNPFELDIEKELQKREMLRQTFRAILAPV